MKITIPLVIILSLLSLSFEAVSREFIETGSKYDNEDYLKLFKIPTSMFTYSNNAGQRPNQDLQYAFDGNWNNCFVAQVENNGDFRNEVTINFKKTVNLEGMIYQCQALYEQGYAKTWIFKYKLK